MLSRAAANFVDEQLVRDLEAIVTWRQDETPGGTSRQDHLASGRRNQGRSDVAGWLLNTTWNLRDP